MRVWRPQAPPAQWVPHAHAGVHSAVDLGQHVMLAPARLTLATLKAATRPAISGARLVSGVPSGASTATVSRSC